MYPNPDGSSYPKGGGVSSKKNVADYDAQAEDMSRAHGGPDKWTQAMLDKLNNGKPITTQRSE